MAAFQVMGFFGRNYFWVEQQFRWDPYIVSKNLKKFVRLDPLAVESMGTGKIYNILDTGTNESVQLLLSFLAQSIRVFWTTGFAFFLVR